MCAFDEFLRCQDMAHVGERRNRGRRVHEHAGICHDGWDETVGRMTVAGCVGVLSRRRR